MAFTDFSLNIEGLPRALGKKIFEVFFIFFGADPLLTLIYTLLHK
jgi:hypothetical protein